MKNMMKYLFMMLAVAAVLCGCQSVDSEKTAQLKIATCNIQMAPAPEKVYWAQTRRDAEKALQRRYRFDIFGAQETFKHQIDSILPEGYSYVGAGRDDGREAGEYSPIIFNTKKIKCLKSGTFWLSETPEKVSFGWDAACRRVCTWGEFEDTASGKKFYFFNTHLDHVGVKARENGVKLIMRKIAEIAGNNTYFLTGDFNIAPDNPALAPLFASPKFRHARDVSEEPASVPSGTWHAYTGIPTVYIDYIFVSPDVRVGAFYAITDRLGKVEYDRSKPQNKQADVDYASDHFPLCAEVSF